VALGSLRPLPGLRALRIHGLEAIAFARQATLLHRDVAATYPDAAEPGEDVVVVLHGLFATAGVLRPLRRHLEQRAPAATASFTYAPGPGVDAIAQSLADLVDRLPEGVRIHLVGHSLGGVVARWYLQELGGDPRVVQTISMASPFRGTRHARFLPTAAGRDIGPDSEVLRRLARRAHVAAHVPHLSVIAAADRVITEPAAFELGEELVIEDCGHNALLFHPAGPELLCERVRALRPLAEAVGG
jgi:pimeloyl-ACP methyl ester carboxylesterase